MFLDISFSKRAIRLISREVIQSLWVRVKLVHCPASVIVSHACDFSLWHYSAWILDYKGSE